MEFGDSPREAEFRREVRAFLQAEFVGKYPSESDGESEDYQRGQRPEFRIWRQKLAERGWIAPAWPKEDGGAGLGVMGRDALVPGVQRARGRLRPGFPSDPRGPRRRRLHHQRPEDLDVRRAKSRLD